MAIKVFVNMGGAAGWQFVEFFGRDVRHAGSDPLPNRWPPHLQNDPAGLNFGHQVGPRLDPRGSGIDIAGTLTVSQCSLSDNFAGNGDGGGIDNAGTLTVSQCSLSGNLAGDGGGIFNFGGTLTINQCSLSGNSAGSSGGIWNDFGATLNVLNHSSITGNTPDDVQNHGKLNQDKSSTIGVLD